MSKYSSICKAINLMEAMSKIMKDNGSGEGNTAEVINDLQDIAKDVRFGGKWEGDYETVASAITACVNSGANCATCAYRREKGCIRALKTDAAAAIRQLGKKLAEVRLELEQTRKKLELAEHILRQQDQEVKREVAPWQLEEMESGNEPPEQFPWEDDDETVGMAPAAEVMGGEVW